MKKEILELKSIIDSMENPDVIRVASLAVARRRTNGEVFALIADALRGELKRQFGESTSQLLPEHPSTAGVWVKQMLSCDMLDRVESTKNDPILAIEVIKGKHFADTILEYAKEVYYRTYYDCKHSGGVVGSDEVNATKVLRDKLSAVCEEEVLGAFFSQGVERTLNKYTSKSEKERYENYTADGKWRACVLEGRNISSRATASFGKGMVAYEAGSGAQAKNPRPRVERSRGKMNKPQDP